MLGPSFWVVSPNVGNDNRSAKAWAEASRQIGAAFMGWAPDDLGHRKLGYKFANEVREGDVILIARRYRHEPEVVGFGIVAGRYRKKIRGFSPPSGAAWGGSIRRLSPFVIRELPTKLNLIRCLHHTAALRKLNPESNRDHQVVCRWLQDQLANGSALQRQQFCLPVGGSGTSLRPISRGNELEYTVRNQETIKRARRREQQLVTAYEKWLCQRGRSIQVARYERLECDAYEPARRHLIEAKSSSSRSYIRMAVGQLLDYAFLSRPRFGKPRLAILVPTKPEPDIFEWLSTVGISLIWRERGGFVDSAEGVFTID